MNPRIPSILLVGVNGYANRYVENILLLQAQGKATLAGVVDPTASQSRHFAELSACGAPIVSTLAEFFDTGIQADLACIATPIGLHCEQTCDVLAHGINVLCEKPIAGSLEDADRMIAAEKASGKFLAIGFQMSFCKSIQGLKKDVLSGLFGAPIRFRTRVLWGRTARYFQRNSWAGKKFDRAGHAVFDSPVNNATAHYLHNMLYVLGDRLDTAALPTSIEAHLLRANEVETFDTCVLKLRAANTDLFFYTSHTVEKNRDPEFEFVFEKGTVRCTGEGDQLSIVATFTDGSQKDYGNPCDTDDQKLFDCMAKTVDPSLPPLACTASTARPHLFCIESLKSVPVTLLPKEKTHTISLPDGDAFLVVPGLYDRLMSAYDTWSIPSFEAE